MAALRAGLPVIIIIIIIIIKEQECLSIGHYSVIAQQDAEANQLQERQLQVYIDPENSAAFRKQSFLF